MTNRSLLLAITTATLSSCIPTPLSRQLPTARATLEADTSCDGLLERYHAFSVKFHEHQSVEERRSLRDHMAVRAHACGLDAEYMQAYAPSWEDLQKTKHAAVYSKMLTRYAQRGGDRFLPRAGLLFGLHGLGHHDHCRAVAEAVSTIPAHPSDARDRLSIRNTWLSDLRRGCPDEPLTLELARKTILTIDPVDRAETCAYLASHGDASDLEMLETLASTDSAYSTTHGGAVFYPVRDTCREAAGRIELTRKASVE